MNTLQREGEGDPPKEAHGFLNMVSWVEKDPEALWGKSTWLIVPSVRMDLGPREARKIVMAIVARGWLDMLAEINLYGEQISLINADVGVCTCVVNRSGLVIVAALCRTETDPNSQPHHLSAGPRSEQTAATVKDSNLGR